jgi:predicted NUDIX family NTP pyrophosphohydrolase
MPRQSAGILLYRKAGASIEVLIAHPGGPYWRNKDAGAWSIPKGEIAEGEDRMAAALRELAEETGATVDGELVDLGSVTLRSGKVVYAWGALGHLDEGEFVSNTFMLEWPSGSGRMIECPELDRAEWMDPAGAVGKLNPAQAVLVERLVTALQHEISM